jgi:hypothetical protein
LNIETHYSLGVDSFTLSGVDPDIKADLDAFLYRYAYRYFKDVRDAIDSRTPGCDRTQLGTCYLYTGPTYLGTWGNPGYAQVLQAAADFVDVYPYYTWPDWLPDYRQRLDFVYTHFGDKPIFAWEAFTGGRDSPHPVDLGDQVRPPSNTQEARAGQYQTLVRAMQSFRYPNGTYPGVGVRFWDLQGSVPEVMNWGILTPNDDPLDGYCPGPGIRQEMIPGGAAIADITVSGSTATVRTKTFHSVSVGTLVRIAGASVDTDLNGEYPVTAITSTGFTLRIGLNVAPWTYNESTLRIEYAKYRCGGSTAVCMMCTTGANRYLATDPRFTSDPDGPYNNTFGNFLSGVTEANGYWLNLR